MRNAPESWKDGLAAYGAVSDARTQKVDPAELGPAFPRTHHVLWLEFGGDWTSYWVYIAGPIAGTLIAVGCALVLRGRGGDVISRAAGSGVLDEGVLAAKAELSEEIEQGRVVPWALPAPMRSGAVNDRPRAGELER